MDIEELYTRACFRFYREEGQSGAYDLYAISRIYNYAKEDWDILLLGGGMEGEGVFDSMDSLYNEYFATGSYASVMEVPFVEYNKQMVSNIKNEGTWEYEEILPVVKISEVKRVAYRTSGGKTFLTEDET